MLKKLLIAVAALLGLVAVAGVGLVLYASHRVDKTYDVPLPQVTRATGPDAVARGEAIFQVACAECHVDLQSERAVGRHVREAPAVLGALRSANITSHPEGGIGAWKDEEVARMILNGINREGKARLMASYRYMADEDVAALIAFLRSDHPYFAPVAEKQPKSELTAVGKLIQVFVFGINDVPRGPVTKPPKAPTVEYGQYMATGVYDCFFCHTEGLSGNKLNEPNLYAGGFEFDVSGTGGQGFIYSPNITPHPTAGIGSWSLDDFKRAMRDGISKDGTVIRPPMQKYRYADDVELEAIYRYLKTVPASDKPTKPSTVARQKAPEGAKPAELFATLGCQTCHGETGMFAAKIKQARGKTAAEVAKWIRNPESFKPGTQMPTYAPLLTEAQAVELAGWVLENKANAP